MTRAVGELPASAAAAAPGNRRSSAAACNGRERRGTAFRMETTA
jgi:hypothetical protein